jgi:hypothetical protein
MSPGVTILLVVVAVFAGISLIGLYGDVVVGWVVFGIASLVEAVASWSARAVRRLTPTRRPRSPGLAGTRATSPVGRLP